MIPSWIVQADPGVSQDTFLKSVVVISTFFALLESTAPIDSVRCQELLSFCIQVLQAVLTSADLTRV